MGVTQPLILVVGASGQLGAVIVRKLRARGLRVRALIRSDSKIAHLTPLHVETITGDLLDRESLDVACQGADYVIATANSALPRKRSDRFESVDGEGYRNLIKASKGCGVRQFIYCSVASTPRDVRIPLFRAEKIQSPGNV